MNMDISTPEGMANAIEWQANHLSRISQGGVWGVPRSLSIYRIDHVKREATKLCGDPEPDIQKVFEAMGWTVVDAPPEELP